MGDYVGLIAVAAVVVAIFLARRRKQTQMASALASVKLEGIEMGRQQVLASIGSTVVVNNHNGNGISSPDNGAAADIDAATWNELVRNGVDRARVDFGVPVGLHSGDHDGDPRVQRTEALTEGNVTRIGFGEGRGPGS